MLCAQRPLEGLFFNFINNWIRINDREFEKLRCLAVVIKINIKRALPLCAKKAQPVQSLPDGFMLYGRLGSVPVNAH